VPSDQLAALQAELEKDTAELESLTKKRDSLRTDIDALKATVEDYAKTVDDYKEQWKSLKQKKSDLDHYARTKETMLEAAVHDKKPRILQCIASVDEWIAHSEEYARSRRAYADQMQAAADAAAQKAADAEQRYDEIKSSAPDTAAVLEDLETRRKAIEQEEETNAKLKTARMYFLLLELQKRLREVSIRMPDDFELELCRAWSALNDAKSSAREAVAAAAAASQDAQQAEAKRDENKGKRQEKVFDCLDHLCGDPAQQGTTPAYGSTPAAAS
jgi:chromosome segregation ATPase